MRKWLIKCVKGMGESISIHCENKSLGTAHRIKKNLQMVIFMEYWFLFDKRLGAGKLVAVFIHTHTQNTQTQTYKVSYRIDKV